MWDKIEKLQSTDSNVSKFVFTKGDAVAESVLYKYPNYQDRTVICCSTQSGCPVGCRFCGAGDHFVRSLTAEEIISQPMHLLHTTGVKTEDIRKLQIMFMSMGEPMLNYGNLEKALKALYGLYPYASLLISTSAPKAAVGAFPLLNGLSQDIPTIGLQFSVHESTDEARAKLIPSPTMSLAEIAFRGTTWNRSTRMGGHPRQPFFNYCVHENNNTDADVERLVTLFDPTIWQATLSVICERDESIAAANDRQSELAAEFTQKMLEKGFGVRMFNPAGQDDVGGGCGQLFHVQNWMKTHPDKIKATKGCGLPVLHRPI